MTARDSDRWHPPKRTQRSRGRNGACSRGVCLASTSSLFRRDTSQSEARVCLPLFPPLCRLPCWGENKRGAIRIGPPLVSPLFQWVGTEKRIRQRLPNRTLRTHSDSIDFHFKNVPSVTRLFAPSFSFFFFFFFLTSRPTSHPISTSLPPFLDPFYFGPHFCPPLFPPFCQPQMVLPGFDHPSHPSPRECAQLTLRTLQRTVPPAVPAIMFLSGGQSEEVGGIGRISHDVTRGMFSFSPTFVDTLVCMCRTSFERVVT